MATKVWVGSVSGAGTLAGNWAGGVAPIAGDTIVADSRAQRAMISSIDFSALALADVHFYSGYRFGLGQSGVPFAFNAAEFLWQGAGDAYIDAKGGTTARTIIDAQSGVVRMSGTSGQMQEIEWMRGIGYISNATNIDVLQVTDRNIIGNTEITLNNTNGLDLLVQNGGVVHMNNTGAIVTGDAVILAGGEFYVDVDDGTDGTGLSTVYQTGGLWMFRATSTSWDVADYHLAGGLLTAEDTQATLHAITLLRQYPGGELRNKDKMIVTTHRIMGTP